MWDKWYFTTNQTESTCDHLLQTSKRDVVLSQQEMGQRGLLWIQARNKTVSHPSWNQSFFRAVLQEEHPNPVLKGHSWARFTILPEKQGLHWEIISLLKATPEDWVCTPSIHNLVQGRKHIFLDSFAKCVAWRNTGSNKNCLNFTFLISLWRNTCLDESSWGMKDTLKLVQINFPQRSSWLFSALMHFLTKFTSLTTISPRDK